MQPLGRSPDTDAGIPVLHRIPGFLDRWVVEDGTVPEASWHDRNLELVKAILDYWVRRSGRDAAVFRDLAVRPKRDKPKVGFSPDIIVVVPAPLDAGDLPSLRLWEPGNHVPSFALEVVSPSHPYKDYGEIPDQCAALAVGELVVFDPRRAGPRAFGGPQLLQVWRSTDAGTFERVAAGDGPYWSEFLGAYLMATEDRRFLRIADDPEGKALWPTEAEAERTEKESALARLAELERERAQRGGSG